MLLEHFNLTFEKQPEFLDFGCLMPEFKDFTLRIEKCHLQNKG